MNSYEKACSIRKHKAGDSVPYYTTKDKEQRKKVRKLFNECKKTKNWPVYYKELSIYSSNLRKRERKGFQDHCSSINSVHDSAKMFKILSKDPTQTVGSLLLPTGEYTKDHTETYKYLLDYHFPDSKIMKDVTQRQVGK